MKTKTITAIEQALSDICQNAEPRRDDEFTCVEMQKKLTGVMSQSSVERRLRELVASGEYTRRRMGCDFLYRKN